MNRKNALKVEKLTKIYSEKSSKEIKALNNLNLEVKEGEIFGLLGPNGAGKTTFLNILAGTVVKNSGSVEVWGYDLDKNPRQVRSSIGIVPQEVNLDAFFSPYKLLELQAGLYGISKKELAGENEIIEIKGVRGRESNSISQLELSEVIEPRITEILQLSFDEIKKSGFENKLNFGVVITGGGSQLNHLIDLAQEIFSMPVRIGYPEVIDENYDNYKDNPRYSTAIGIIQYALENNKEIISKLDAGILTSFINFFKIKIKKLVKWY